jgi:hypothetical protein
MPEFLEGAATVSAAIFLMAILTIGKSRRNAKPWLNPVGHRLHNLQTHRRKAKIRAEPMAGMAPVAQAFNLLKNFGNIRKV